tara:strand:+ start:689 stop:1057 length:369 start_codon:yes stop_codon:yes gene_type:complete
MFVQPDTDAQGILNLSWHKVFRKIILKCEDAGLSSDAQLYFIRNNSWKSWNGISSDSRIKENQTDYPIEDSMNIVKTIKVKKYFNTELNKEVKGVYRSRGRSNIARSSNNRRFKRPRKAKRF